MDPAETATSLLVAAVGACGEAPHDPAQRAKWLGEASELAVTLYRRSQDVAAEIERLQSCTTITGVIVEVKEHSGRGLITLRPTMGDDQTKTEHLRTPFLNEPKGAALFVQAQGLVGTNVRFGKWYETIAEGPSKGQKVRMCAWLEPIGAAPSQPAPVATPAQSTPSAPPAQPAPSAQPASIAELRRQRPATANDLVEIAAFHFHMTKEQVREVTHRVLGPPPADRPRSQAELTRVWRTILDERPFDEDLAPAQREPAGV